VPDTRAFVGNDVVDRRSPLLERRAEAGADAARRWRERHLTLSERARGEDFWSLFAAKEAAWKALFQAGVEVPRGAFRELDADLSRRRVTHLASELAVDIVLLDANDDRIHCVAVYSEQVLAMDVRAALVAIRAGEDPGDAARTSLLRLAAEDSPEGVLPDRFAVGVNGGAPALLESGQWLPASVSLAHAGRYAAASLLRH
jgi:phosphopantetheinyl transferase (holo-ACP synthase)